MDLIIVCILIVNILFISLYFYYTYKVNESFPEKFKLKKHILKKLNGYFKRRYRKRKR